MNALFTQRSEPRFGVILAFLGALAVLSVFIELGRMDVTTENEGQRAAPPAEMLRSGDYLIPTLNGQVYLAKPPLLYWMIAGAYWGTGVVNEWTARLPTGLCAVFMVLLAYAWFAKSTDAKTAGLTALGLLASPYFLERARWANIDIPLALATFCVIMLLRAAWESPRLHKRLLFSLAAGVSLGAATLLKGPAPYLFVGAAFVAYVVVADKNADLIVRRGIRWAVVCFILEVGRMSVGIPIPGPLVLLCGGWLVLALVCARATILPRVWPLLVALVVGAAVAAPWGIAVISRMGWDPLITLVQDEVLTRTHTATKINSGSPLYYVLALPVMLAPWGFLLPLQFSRKLWAESLPIYRFSLLTGWMSVIVFSLIAGKEYEYVLPAVPFLLLPTAYHLGLASEKLPGIWARWFMRWQHLVPLVLCGTAAGVVLWVCLREYHPVLLLETLVLACMSLVILFIPGRGWPVRFSAPRLGLATVLLVTAVLLPRAFRRADEHSPKQLAQLCGELLESGHHLEASKVYASFAFYAGQPVPIVVDPLVVKERLAQALPYFYVTRTELVELFDSAFDAQDKRIAGPVTKKNMILLSNILPEELGSTNGAGGDASE